MIDESVLQPGERLTLALRSLYAAHGYQLYRMSKFEEYDLYARNKEFLLSDNVITFTDTDGRLMALKPDVTLSIIKNSRDDPAETQKLCYNENVYRVSESSNSFHEIMQTGVECFGAVSEEDLCQVVELAAQSMQLIPQRSVLSVSSLSVLEQAAAYAAPERSDRAQILRAIGERNMHELRDCCTPERAALLEALLDAGGTIDEALSSLRALFSDVEGFSSVPEFLRLLEMLRQLPCAQQIRVDFSIVSDINYYNGLIFKGFVAGIPSPVLSGGQYDRLMRKLHRQSRAVGFAVSTDLLAQPGVCAAAAQEDTFLNIALPKGRLGEKVYAMLAKAGLECPAILETGRKLIFENTEKRVRYFWVKPSDVAIYVERGAADLGVAGKDILLEYRPDVYELLDLRFGACRMAVAAKNGFKDDTSRTLRVATKFPNIAKAHFQSEGRDIDIIHLNGSIELAPILGMADVIVDIVETGTTLRENNLSVVQTIVPISARLVANKSSYKFKEAQIRRVASQLKTILEEPL